MGYTYQTPDYDPSAPLTYSNGDKVDPNDPQYGRTLSGTQITSSSASKNTSGTSLLAAKPTPAAPPVAPNYSNLTNLLDQTQRQGAIKTAMSDYDALYASTQASGFQNANNAGNAYGTRLEQQGINPVASGVVAAQARLPIYKALGDITTQKDTTRLDAVNKSNALAAQIASTIAQIQLGYSKTLADFNIQNTQMELDLNKFNASQGLNVINSSNDFQLKQKQLAAQLAAAGLNPDGTTKPKATGVPTQFSPGYSGNPGTFIIPDTVNGSSGGHDVSVGWPSNWITSGG